MFDDQNHGPTADEVKTKMESLGASCTIGLETAPSTGRKHYHVYAYHPKGFNTRNVKTFDVVTYHPNIRQVTSKHQTVWDYVTKGGQIVVDDVPRPETQSKKTNQIDQVFSTALQQDSYTEMLRTIEQGAPTKYATSYLNIRSCAKDRFPQAPDFAYTHPRDATFNTDPWPELGEWLDQYLPQNYATADTIPWSSTPSLTSGSISSTCSVFSGDDWGLEPENQEDQMMVDQRYDTNPREQVPVLNGLQSRPKSLILWGPTRTGKTVWARSLGLHVHHANTFNLGLHDSNARYAVFDDITGGLREIHYKSWLGGQLHFTVTDKYMKKKTFTWGKPCIYIANENPYKTDKGVDFDWLSKNTVIVHIHKQMY